MELNLEMEGAGNGGLERASSSDDGQLLVAFSKMWKMMQKEVKDMVILYAPKVIVPIMEDLIRKVVKEEIQALEKLMSHGNQINANEMAVSQGRNLYLKFLDEVSLPFLTGKPIEGKGGTKLKVGLFDKTTGQVVNCGPQSSGRVEILVLDDNEHNYRLEDFNDMIIKEGDKTKPHFAKRVYVYLKDGIGILDNAKLGHDSIWTKKYECRLGARMENFTGGKVQEAWTERFTVLDKRNESNDKNRSPSLSDNVSRLKNIGKSGGQRLNENNIKTVKDFLFLQSIDPNRLQQIVSKGAKWESSSASASKWKTTVDHAKSCIINDETVFYYQSSKYNMGVAFDVVGRLKGIIHDSYYMPYDNLSEDKKESSHKLLLSAFENQNDVKSYEDEAALLHHFPLRPSSTSSSTVQKDDLSTSGIINGCYLMEPSTSSQRISPPIEQCDRQHNFCHLGETTMGQTYDYSFLSWLHAHPDLPLEQIASTIRAELRSHQLNDADRGLRIMLCMVRARKRFMALGGIHVQKRQRTN